MGDVIAAIFMGRKRQTIKLGNINVLALRDFSIANN